MNISREGVYRPGGVTALAVLFIVFAAAGIIGMVAIMQWEQSMFNQSLTGLLLEIVFGAAGTPEQLAFGFTATALIWQTNYQALMGTLNIMLIGVLILSTLLVLSSVGLLYMKKWGYYLALTVGIIFIIASIIAVIPTFGFSLITLIAAVLIVRYLRREEIKSEFQ